MQRKQWIAFALFVISMWAGNNYGQDLLHSAEASAPHALDRTGPLDTGTVIVKFIAGLPREAGRTGVVQGGAAASLSGQYLVNVPPDSTAEAVASLFRRLPIVEYAEPNYLLAAAAVPNDAFYQLQSWYYQVIDAPDAWDVTTGGAEVIVAVLDTGIDPNHPDLADNIWRNPREAEDGLDNDGNGYVDDIRGWNFVGQTPDTDDDNAPGHGTLVAGLIAAQGNNSVGTTGVAWRASLMPVKIANSGGNATSLDVATGIIYAAANGARVINISLAGPCTRIKTLGDAINEAQSRYGAIIIGAAGNGNEPCVSYPAAEAGVIAVGSSAGPIVQSSEAPGGALCDIKKQFEPNRRALFSQGSLSSGSNWGPEIDVAAPGQCLTSTGANGLYLTHLQGTSFSAALVAGQAALILARNPDLNPFQVRDQICATALDQRDEGTPNWDGCGLINVRRSVRAKTLHMFKGWNFQTWSVEGCLEPRKAMANLIQQESMDVVWRFDGGAQRWLGFDPRVPDVINTLPELCARNVVVVHISQESDWVQTPP